MALARAAGAAAAKARLAASRRAARALLLLPLGLGSGANAAAAELWRDDAGAVVTWDTTLTQTEAFRIAPRNPVLLADPNADDGDRRSGPGLISDRTDLLSELDYTNGGFGVNVGLAAWYDPVYLHANHNDLSRRPSIPSRCRRTRCRRRPSASRGATSTCSMPLCTTGSRSIACR